MKRKSWMAVATAAVASLAMAASASAATSAVTLSEDSLDFGSQQVGTTSATQSVTLNVPCLAVVDYGAYGGKHCVAPGVVDSVGVTGPFEQTNNCPTPIVNTATDGSVVTCTITVTFKPTANGPATGELQLGGYGQPNAYTAALSGSGFTPAPETGNGGNGGAKDKNSASSGSGSTAGVAGKKCAKKGKKGAKKAKKCAKKKSARR